MNEQHPNPTGTESNGNGGELSSHVDPALHQRLRAVTKDFNHRELAELTGVSLETSRRYFEGRGPGLAYIKRLCDALGISADWLLLGRGAPVYRPGIPVGQMDTSVDEVLEGLSKYLKRLHLELARAGTGLQHSLLKPTNAPTGETSTVPAAGPNQPATPEVSPEEFADPFAPGASMPGVTEVKPVAAALPVQVRLVLGAANGRQVLLPASSPAEILVMLDDQGEVIVMPAGSETLPGVHLYRRVFDRVYRWVGASRSP